MALPLNFAGKHCAVVGGTGVIGAAIAKAFAHEGAAVTVLGRRALEVRDELEPELPPCEPVGEMPPAHRFIKLDAGNLQEIKNTFAPTYLASRCKYTSDPALPRASDFSNPDAVGSVDVLVNCAGVAHTSLLKRTEDLSIANVVDTNLVSAMIICKYAMMRPYGCIINVSSLMANKGGLGATAYAASKAGLVGK